MPLPLVVALGVHLAALWWLHQQFLAGEPPEVRRVVSADLDAPVDEIVVTEEPDEPTVIEAHDTDVEPLTDTLDDPSEIVTRDDLLGLGGMGGGGGGGRGSAASILGVGPGEGADGVGHPFRSWIDDLRARGVEVAIVIDATGSMQAFIERARDTIDAVANDLATVVPGVRLAVVAYRDLNDPWTTRHVDFARHPYRVSNFLLELEASGGMRASPDFEEAVEEGLKVAVEQLDWTDGARHVILLVGDAPYHDEDKGEVFALVRDFTRGQDASLFTVYVGVPDSGRPSSTAVRAREAWERLADAGDGLAVELLLPRQAPSGTTDVGRYTLGSGGAGVADDVASDPTIVALRRQVVDAAFGPEWRGEVDRWIAGAAEGPRARSVQRHIDRQDRPWLVRQLLGRELHPELIRAALVLFDGQVAGTCYRVLADETRDPAVRWALLSVLKRRVADVREIPFDPERPIAEQTQALALIRKQVARLPGAAAAMVPPDAAAAGPAPPPLPPSGG